MKRGTNYLGTQMHGGRKGRTTQDALLIQNISYDVLRQAQICFITLNLDAAKCLDRMFLHIAAITLSRLGLELNFGKSLAITLNKMEHRVKTTAGVSMESIYQTNEDMWSGVGQENAAAGPIWMDIEAKMLAAYEKTIQGLNLHRPDGKYKFNVSTIGYIDDNNLNITYEDYDPTVKEMYAHGEQALQKWNDLLGANVESLHIKSAWDI